MERDFMGLKVKVKQEIQEETHDPGIVFFFINPIQNWIPFEKERKKSNGVRFTFGLNLIFRKITLFWNWYGSAFGLVIFGNLKKTAHLLSSFPFADFSR